MRHGTLYQRPRAAPKPGESEELWNRMNSFRAGGMRLSGFNRLTLSDKERALYSVFAWTTTDPADANNLNVITAGGVTEGVSVPPCFCGSVF